MDGLNTSSMATARTDTTHGATYSITRAIGLLHAKKVDAIVCIVAFLNPCLTCVKVTCHMD